MAQNERQGVGTEKAGTKTGAESTGGLAASRATAEQGSEGTGTGREQSQSGGRLSRREGWDDPISGFFGGSPFALFRRLSDDMDRIFFGGGQGLGAFGGLGFGGRFLPHIDINEHDGKLVVNADLPGVRPEDFQV